MKVRKIHKNALSSLFALLVNNRREVFVISIVKLFTSLDPLIPMYNFVEFESNLGKVNC
jgi:hypothetical protein